jgi:hypothetical protein
LPGALVALTATAVAGQEPGVVIALDSSRSLSAEQSQTAAALARDLLVRLEATTAPSVLTFDDGVHWLARPGEARADAEDAAAALAALRPTGRFTVLNDGMIAGVRALDDGGVLVVISDGRDENSATTLEDVARLASERRVRVVTFGAGRVDERTMKRLALLTGGLYVGATEGADADILTAEIEALRREVAIERTPAAEPPPAVETAAPPAVAAPAPPPASAPDFWRPALLAFALVAVMGIGLGYLLARRRSAPEPDERREPDVGTAPGVAVPEPAPPQADAREPGPPPVDEIQLARLRSRPQLPADALVEVSLDDTAAFQNLPFSESIERTLVLTEEVVLSVREPGREKRSIRLPPGRAIDVGREPSRNTLAFQDPTMSMQHLRLAFEGNEVLLADLGSTNGVLFEGRRVDSARLEPGDRFRAGMIEFELGLHRASVG